MSANNLSTEQKIFALKKILDKSHTVKGESSSDPDFKSWKNLVERTLRNIFGIGSTELEHFTNLDFYYATSIMIEGDDYISDDIRCFRRDFKILKDSIHQYIEEFEESNEKIQSRQQKNENKQTTKVFISHATKDKNIVEELIDILELIGVESNQIFCSSFEGYGIALGENFLDRIKNEISEEALVIFVLSENFYSSKVALCEMGATWVLAREHIPVLIPPFDFKDVEGVLPLTQGLKINDEMKINSLKEKLETLFSINLSMNQSTWERKRDRIIARINNKIKER